MIDRKLDDAIDRTVREMTAVEPPRGLRGRVIERIEKPGRRFGWLWLAAPAAATAVVILVLLVPERQKPAPQPVVVATHEPAAGVPAPDSGVRTAPPLATTTVSTPVEPRDARAEPREPRAEPREPRVVSGRTRRVLAAAIDEAIEDADAAAVPALIQPASLAVAQIAFPEASRITGVEVAPLEVPALEVNALSDTPRERQE